MEKDYIETKIKVRYNEVDRMNVVHNSRYFIYQEEGKNNFLEKKNLDTKINDENGYFSPVTKNEMKYIKPATVGDEILVKTAIYKVTNVEITYVSGIFNKDNELLAYGIVSNCVSDKNMKPLALPKISKSWYLRFKEQEVIEKMGKITKKNIIIFFNKS